MNKDLRLDELNLTRRQALAAAALGAAGVLGLSACSDEPAPSGSAPAGDKAEETIVKIDAAAFDALVADGPVADDATVSASPWASAVRDAGTLRVGGVQTSALFSLMDETDGTLRGFDAGLFQLLTRYILGDHSKFEFTQVTSDTRESVLTNGQVDIVFATYSITDERKKLISFAGPYYTTQQGILVMAGNGDIKGVEDLDGKNVAAQSGSTGPTVLEEFAPGATVQEFKTDEEARSALEQGRVDAYVIDQTMLLSDMAKRPGKYQLAGDPFGPVDPYGIGMPLDSDGVAFVNDFLASIEDSGLWADLWQVSIGDRAEIAEAPEPPAIGA